MKKSTLNLSTIASNLGCGLVAAMLVLGYQAVADQTQPDDVPRIIPYNGYLELDGAPVTLTGGDAPTLTFEICPDAVCASVAFAQSMPVNVYNGQFTALIGEGNADGAVSGAGTYDCIQDAIAGEEALYVRMSVDTGSGPVQLTNIQRLLLSPHAIFATNAADFKVSATLTAEGDVNLGNGAGDVHTIKGDTTFNHNVTLGDGSGDVHTINGDANFEDGVTIDGNATIGDASSDSHTINGATTFNHTVTVSGGAAFRAYGDVSLGDGPGDAHTIKGDTTFNHNVTLGDGSGDVHTINGDANFEDGVTIDGAAYIGSGTPASGSPRLRLHNNVSDGTIDDFNDYQLLLHYGASASGSYGLGVSSSTLFLNSNDEFKFLRGGESIFHIDTELIKTNLPMRMYRGNSEPFACSGSGNAGILWYDSDRSDTNDNDALCVCTHRGGSSYAWKPVHNHDGDTCR